MIINKNLISLTIIILLALGYGCNSQKPDQENTSTQSEKKENPLVEINKSIADDRENDALYIQRADYYLSENKVDSALRDILIAIDIDDRNANHFITLSDAYLAQGNPDKCLEALDKALDLEPQNQEALLKKAQLYLIMRDYDKCHATISTLIKIDRINPIAYFINAMALIEEGDTTASIKNLQLAIDQKQDYFDAQLQLGMLYSAQGNYLAASHLQKAIELMPGVIEPYYQLGLFFQENNRTESAISTYKNILDIDPGYVPALYNLGYIKLVYEQQFRQAADYFSQVIELAPEYADAWYNRGYSYELMGQKQMARKDYEQVLKLKENYSIAIEGLNRLDNN